MRTAVSRKTFADNQRVTVGEAIRAASEYRNHQYPLAIATGYFNLGGFSTIADVLSGVPSVRILIGAEPEQETVPDMIELERDDPKAAIERVEATIVAQRDEVPFTRQSTSEVEKLTDFLRLDTTEVRIYRKRFLHGKAFVLGNEEAVIAGSANFTAAGLNHNLELDLGQFNPDEVRRVSEWYEMLWAEAEPYDLASVFNKRLEEFDPHTVYLRMLYAQYSPEVRTEVETQSIFGAMQLAEFQRIGSQRAVRILDENGGAILADGVGLGKTLVAGDVIREFALTRGLRVLIVAPASLREMWQRFLAQQNLPGKVISYAQLGQAKELGGSGSAVLDLSPAHYRLIVADEAHALRNPDTEAYGAMVELLSKSPSCPALASHGHTG